MNKWVGIGRLTRDPELNFAAGTGTAVARFTLAVTGSIRTGSYDAKDGTKRYTTDIVVDPFEFIGQGNNNNQGNTSQNNFDGMNFEDEMTPDDTGDCPF